MSGSIEDLSRDAIEHYQNTEANQFENGIPAVVSADECRIRLKNVSIDLKRKAIDNLMNQYGSVVDVFVPPNQDQYASHKKGFMQVYVEFSKFSEAARAVSEMNDRNPGLEIRAEFAPRKSKIEADPTPVLLNKPTTEVAEAEVAYRLPITVKYHEAVNDDIHEKVSDFHRRKQLVNYKGERQLQQMKKLASESKGIYDDETDSLVYNRQVFETEPEAPRCIKCKRMALLKCDKTEFYFCSIKCSTLKETPTVKPLKRNEIIYGEPIKANDQVIISAVINEKCLFLKSSAVDENSLLNEILKFAKHAQKLKDFPEVGDLVLALYQDDFYRAKVLDIDEDDDYTIDVQLIDFGNTARVQYDDLLEMEPECQKLPCIAQKVFLKDVAVTSINEEIIDYLDSLLGDKIELTVSQIEGDTAVLIDKLKDKKNVNQEIMKRSEVAEASFDNPGLTYRDYALLNTGRNKKIFVVNSEPSSKDPEMICGIPAEYLKDFYQIYNSINVYANNRKSDEWGTPFAPQEICLAFCNNQWHRSVVVKSFGDGKPLCLLIDLLSFQRINTKQIMPMPTTFATPKPFVVLCTIEGYNDSDEGIKCFKADLKENSVIRVDEIAKDGEAFILKFNAILKPSL